MTSSPTVVRSLTALLSISALVGCSTQNAAPTQQQYSIPSPLSSATSQTQSQPIQPANQPTTQISPSLDIPQAAERDLLCDAQYHAATIAWQQGQAFMTFYRKPNSPLLNSSPAVFTRGNDDSQTYTFAGETTTTVTFYRDNTCLLQVVGSNDNLTVQETGRSQLNRPSIPGSGSGVSSITCSGRIQNSVNFVIYYTRESGFYRAEFYPAGSNRVTANLTSIGQNSQGQQVWSGSDNTAAQVLVTLTTANVQRGSQITVQYGTGIGTGTCGRISALW